VPATHPIREIKRLAERLLKAQLLIALYSVLIAQLGKLACAKEFIGPLYSAANIPIGSSACGDQNTFGLCGLELQSPATIASSSKLD
jgi:hypothetical protein